MADTLSRMGRPRKPEPTEPVRLPRSFARKVRRLAREEDIDPGDYLAREFGPAVDRRHAKWVEQLKEEEGKEK